MERAFTQRIDSNHMITGSRNLSLSECTGTIQNASPSNQNIANCSYLYAMLIADGSSSVIAILRSQCDPSGLHASTQICATPRPATSCSKLAASASFTAANCLTPIGSCAVIIPNDRSKPIFLSDDSTGESTGALRSTVISGDERNWSTVAGKLPHPWEPSANEGRRLSVRGSGRRLEGQRNYERTALAHLARHYHVAAQQPREPAGHAKPKSCTAHATGTRLLHLPERVEYLIAMLVCDADTGIANDVADDR